VISELLKRAGLRRFAKLVPEAKVPILGKIRRETIYCSRRFELDMCQKWKKQGVNRGFYRCVVELVREKLRPILRKRSSNGDIHRQKMGYKLTLVIEYPSFDACCFLAPSGIAM